MKKSENVTSEAALKMRQDHDKLFTSQQLADYLGNDEPLKITLPELTEDEKKLGIVAAWLKRRTTMRTVQAGERNLPVESIANERWQLGKWPTFVYKWKD